ncbi:DUF2079 domain-containing protein [Terriglobus roseus]|uniref:DUF2079 domain-containing protein n=1 Tax=Terriglobus roseus TaxID=392734 RepID=UPI00145D5E61|nr:DUF2079 domain-containing protein [Terriglobus roseus]
MVLSLSRSSVAFTLLLLFVPEYIGRVRPPGLRSALLFAIVTALWVMLATGPEETVANERRSARGSGLLFWIIAGTFFAGVTALAVRKYYVLGYVGQDLAYFAQIMHTTLNGHLFWGSLLQDLLYSHTVTTDFAGHNSPIMFLFLPFYALFPSPITLLVLRNVAMVACIFPAYHIARIYTADKNARLWGAAFLFLPAIYYQTSFDFYPLSFVALPLLYTLLFYLRGEYRQFLCWLGLTLLVREDLALFAIMLACVALLQRKNSRWVLTPLLGGVVWGALSYLYVLPHALHGASFVTDACFSHLGQTPAQMLTRVCSSPQTTLLPHNNLVYLKQLLTPTGLLLPFASPLVLTSLPFLAINLLAGPGRCITTVIAAQYSVVPSVLLFISALLCATGRGLPAKLAHLGLRSARVPPLVFLSLSLGTLVFLTGALQEDELRMKAWTGEARRVAAFVPAGASVAAPRYLLPLLANRDCLYQTHRLQQYHSAVYEYLILDSDWRHIDAAAEYESAYRTLLHDAPLDSRYRVIYRTSAFMVLRDPSVKGRGCFPQPGGAS